MLLVVRNGNRMTNCETAPERDIGQSCWGYISHDADVEWIKYYNR
jgi:hypothetical protein